VAEKVPTPSPVKEKVKPQPAPAEKPKTAVATKPAEKPAAKPAEKPETAAASPVSKPETEEQPETAKGLPIDISEAAALAVIVLVVVGGGFLLMRSAERTRRAAELKKVEIPDPWKSEEPEVEPVQEIDKEYEKEILEELEHVEDNHPQPAAKVAATAPAPAATPKPAPKSTTPAAAVAVAPGVPAPKPVKKPKAKKSNLAGVVVTEGNYNVTVDDYQKYMVPPNREPRQDCLFEVKCTINGEVLDGIGLDISRGGIFIDSKEEFEVGTELTYEFKLRDGDPQPIRGKGIITWRNERPDPIKPNYPNGFGVQFTDLEDGAEELVEAYMQKLEVEVAG